MFHWTYQSMLWNLKKNTIIYGTRCYRTCSPIFWPLVHLFKLRAHVVKNRWPHTIIITKLFCKNPYQYLVRLTENYVKLESQNFSNQEMAEIQTSFFPWIFSLLLPLSIKLTNSHDYVFCFRHRPEWLAVVTKKQIACGSIGSCVMKDLTPRGTVIHR